MTSEVNINLEEIAIPSSSASNAPIQRREGISYLLSSTYHEETLEKFPLIWTKPKNESEGIKLCWDTTTNCLEKYFRLLYTLIYGILVSILDLVTDLVVAFGFYREDRTIEAFLTIIFPIIATIFVYRKKMIERDYKKIEGIIRPNYNKKWDKGLKFCENTPIPFIKSIYLRVFHSVLEWNCRNLPEKPITLFDLANYTRKLNEIEALYESVPEVMLQTILFFNDLKLHKSISDGRILSISVSVLKTSYIVGNIWISKLKYVFLEEDKWWGWLGKFLLYLESITLIVLRVATVNVIFYCFNELIVFSDYVLEIFLVSVWLLFPRIVFTLLTYKSRNFGDKFYFELRKQYFYSIWHKWIISVFFYPIHVLKPWIIAYVHFENLIATSAFFYTSLYPKYLIHLFIIWGAYVLAITARFLFVKIIFESKSRSFLTAKNIVKNCGKALDSLLPGKDQNLQNINFSNIMDATQNLSNSIIEADKKNHCLSFKPEYKENELLKHMEYNILKFNVQNSAEVFKPYENVIEMMTKISGDIPFKPLRDYMQNMAESTGKISENPKDNSKNFFKRKTQNDIFKSGGDLKGSGIFDMDKLTKIYQDKKVSLLDFASQNFTVPAKTLMDYVKENKPSLSNAQGSNLKSFLENEIKLTENQVETLHNYCLKYLYPFSQVNQKESEFYKGISEILGKKVSGNPETEEKKNELIYFVWLNFYQFSDLEINNLLAYCSKNFPNVSEESKRKLVTFIKIELPNWKMNDIRWILKYFHDGYLKLSHDQLKSLINYNYQVENSNSNATEGIERIPEASYIADIQNIYTTLKMWNKTRLNDLINFCNNNGPYPYNNAYKNLKEEFPESTGWERGQYIKHCMKEIGIKADCTEEMSENGVDLVVNKIQLNALIKLTYLKIFYTTTEYLKMLKETQQTQNFEEIKEFLTCQMDFILAHDLMAYESYPFVVPLQTFSSFKFRIGARFDNLFNLNKCFKDLMKFYKMLYNYKYSDEHLEKFLKIIKDVKMNIEYEGPIELKGSGVHLYQENQKFSIFERIDLELRDQVSLNRLQFESKNHEKLERDNFTIIQELWTSNFDLQTKSETIKAYKREIKKNYNEKLKPQLLYHLKRYFEKAAVPERDSDLCELVIFLVSYVSLKEEVEMGLELGESTLNFIDEEVEWKEIPEYLRNLPFKSTTRNETSWLQKYL